MMQLLPVYLLLSMITPAVWANVGGKVVSILTLDDDDTSMKNNNRTKNTQRQRRRRLPHVLTFDDLLFSFDDECPGPGRWDAFQEGSSSGQRRQRKLEDALVSTIVINSQTLEFDATIEWGDDCTGPIDRMVVDDEDFFPQAECADSFFDIYIGVDCRRRLEDGISRLSILLVGGCETECTTCSSFAILMRDVGSSDRARRLYEEKAAEEPPSAPTAMTSSANDASSTTERRLDDYFCVVSAYLDLEDSNFEYDDAGRLQNVLIERENCETALDFEDIEYEYEVDESDDDGICLSPYSTVFVRDCTSSGGNRANCETNEIFMKDLQQGDEILVDVATQKYQKVYAFGHLDLFSVANFVQIETLGMIDSSATKETAGPGVLEITGEHLLFKAQADDLVGGGIPVRASSIEVGDDLATAESKVEPTNRVTNVNHVSRPGLYTPLVQDGTFIANGVKVSCYTAIPQRESSNGNDAQYVKLGNHPIVSHHTLNHVAATPLRVMCQNNGKDQSVAGTLFCEQRNTEGQLLYVSVGDQICSWCSQQNVVVQGLVLTLLCLILLPFFGMEQLMMSHHLLDVSKVSLLVLSVATILLYLKRCQSANTEKPRGN